MMDEDDPVYHRFVELCSDLNLDNSTRENTWFTFSAIREKYTLEGDPSHWLCCAVYVACRQATVPSVGSPALHGSYVNLTRLLRTSRLSLVEFFEKSRKWGDMTNLNQEFRSKIERLERNFAVTTVIFKKFEPIFCGVFKDFTRREPFERLARRRHLPRTAADLFEFCWTLFLCVKSSLRISDDLVNSYHLLLACTDLIFHNVVQGGMRNLLTTQFAELTETNVVSNGEGLCIIHKLCDLYDGISVEAKTIKEFWLKPKIRNMIESGILLGDAESLSGLIEESAFEGNSKKLEKEYEEYVLTEGDFDERMYLSSEKQTDFGVDGNCEEYLKSLEKQPAIRTYTPVHELRHLLPQTPLTCKRFLSEKDDVSNSPITAATQCVSRLQALLCGRMAEPSIELKELLHKCDENYQDRLAERLNRLGTIFCTQYSGRHDNQPGLHSEFARFRCQLGQTLYYRLLESILVNETKLRSESMEFKDLVGEDMFQSSLFACSLEIVLYSYNSQRRFPWILDIFELPAYYFYKVIEVVIRAEENLCRDVVKHLSQVEEKVLEELVWKADSPLWLVLQEKNDPIPSCEDVLLPSQMDKRNDHDGSDGSQPKRYAVIKTPSGEKCVPVTVGESNKSTLIIQDKTSSQILGVVLPSKHGDKPKIGNSIALFFRKFYHLVFVRLQDLCKNLGVNEENLKKIWTCLQQGFVNYLEELLKNRHADQIIMCCVYVVSKVLANEKTFTEIMRCYRLQPQSTSHVYRSVLLKGDERGDLIKFYNTIFIGRMQKYAMRFSPRVEDTAMPLSPVPHVKMLPLSPCRKMSSHHSIFLRPLRGAKTPSPVKQLRYSFARSPTNTLKAINAMVQVGTESKTKAVKRILADDSEEAGVSTKIFAKRLQEFIDDKKTLD